MLLRRFSVQEPPEEPPEEEALTLKLHVLLAPRCWLGTLEPRAISLLERLAAFMSEINMPTQA
jgi:hypothetical protein